MLPLQKYYQNVSMTSITFFMKHICKVMNYRTQNTHVCKKWNFILLQVFQSPRPISWNTSSIHDLFNHSGICWNLSSLLSLWFEYLTFIYFEYLQCHAVLGICPRSIITSDVPSGIQEIFELFPHSARNSVKRCHSLFQCRLCNHFKSH